MFAVHNVKNANSPEWKILLLEINTLQTEFIIMIIKSRRAWKSIKLNGIDGQLITTLYRGLRNTNRLNEEPITWHPSKKPICHQFYCSLAHVESINFVFLFSTNIAWFTICCSRCRFTLVSVTSQWLSWFSLWVKLLNYKNWLDIEVEGQLIDLWRLKRLNQGQWWQIPHLPSNLQPHVGW